jgi:hypothetical protein
MLAFCAVDGGFEELSGVFGGWPLRASSSAMRAFSRLTSSKSMSILPSNDTLTGGAGMSGEHYSKAGRSRTKAQIVNLIGAGDQRPNTQVV